MTSRSHATGRVTPLAKVGTLGELAALVPYLMGFVPTESLVCLGLDGRGGKLGRVGLTARLDLADARHPTGGAELLRSTVATVARTGARVLVVFVVSEADTVDDVVIDRLLDAVAHTPMHLADVGWHRGSRCWSLVCEDPLCCPPEGFVVDRAFVPAVAAAYAGTAVLPDRAAVEAEFADTGRGEGLDPLIADHEAALLRADLADDGAGSAAAEAAEAVLELARLHDAHEADPRGLPPVPDDVVAACLAALGHVAVRDQVWLAVDAREVDGGAFWLDLARRAPAPYDASPLFLLGWRCWRRGDGVRAVLAAERADATPGGYSAARLLLDAVGAGVDPRSVPLLSA